MYRILRRNELNLLPTRVDQRAIHIHRYANQVSEHYIQIDVMFLTLIENNGEATRRYRRQVKRSHRPDKPKRYQLRTHKGHVDRGMRLAE